MMGFCRWSWWIFGWWFDECGLSGVGLLVEGLLNVGIE